MNSVLLFIEIYLNQVLYLRGIYPRQIFRKQKAYSLPVFSSIYPPLNQYLKNLLYCISNLLEAKVLKKIEIVLYNHEIIQESFIINIDNNISLTTETFLLNEQFRSNLYNLEKSCKKLNHFKRSSIFKILLHTDEKTYNKLCNDSAYQDFLWIKVDGDGEERRKGELVPISSDSNFISLYIEQFR